jgi:hypothetical protein
VGRRSFRFRGSKRRVRNLERRHGRGINLWLLFLAFLLVEALAVLPWLLFEIVLDHS